MKYEKTRSGIVNILGNGPSLAPLLPQFQRSQKEFYFVVNDFAISSYFPLIRPAYYVLIDPAYFEEITNNNDIEMREKVFSRMRDLVSWKMELFVPYSVLKCKLLMQLSVNDYIKICPFNHYGFYPTKSIFYKYILMQNLGTVPVGNVLGAAIHIAINKGYKEIHLYGVEHSWTKDIRVNDNNQVCTIKKHFYNEGELSTELVPWRASDTHVFKMYEILQCLTRHFYGYFVLEWYSSLLGCKIINYTPGSFIDAFERQ